jgi:hypothetical protein
VNDHYHRLKRKIVQKVMRAFGEKPKECISQPELESVRDTLRGMGLDPQKLDLRLCEQAPPECQSFDVSGKLLGWEVTCLYNPEVEETNAEAKIGHMTLPLFLTTQVG